MKVSNKFCKKGFPSEIKMLSKVYEIQYHPLACPEDQEDVLWGKINFTEHNIKIYNTDKSSDIEIWNTLMHELLHLIVEMLQINFKKDSEEKVVDNISTMMVHLFKENNLKIK